MYDFKTYDKTGFPHKFFTLSFDDGVTQDRRFIKLLNDRGLKCTFNLNSKYFGLKGMLETPDFKVPYDRVEADEVRTLYNGHEVASHTVSHPRLDLLTQDEVFHEVEDDRIRLEELSGQKIFGMAYPGGPFFNNEVINTITSRTPIRYARSTGQHYTFEMPDNLMIWDTTCHIPDEEPFDLARQFVELKPDKDVLFYVWGHSYEFDVHRWWDKLEEFLDIISGHDDICYATNGEIARYIFDYCAPDKG